MQIEMSAELKSMDRGTRGHANAYFRGPPMRVELVNAAEFAHGQPDECRAWH